MVPVTLARCALSTISVFELFVGVAKSDRSNAERMKVERLLQEVQVAIFDAAAAQKAARVRATLEKLGLPLATNNVREFARVEGLQLEDWLA